MVDFRERPELLPQPGLYELPSQRRQVDTDPLPVQTLGTHARPGATAERVQDHVATVRTRLYDSIQQSERFLRRIPDPFENRIKELLDGLQIDRTSCCRFLPNQLRVLLTAAACVLMQELRLRAARTACARTQVT